jgi:predicted RNA-binding protein with RPS1 domain
MDLDSIEPGLDFADVIEDAVNSCAVLVALIGRQWVTLTDDDGGRRLDNPDDFVRFEVKTALDRGVRVIPVLIDGARPLRQQQLPADLHKLARLNAHKLSYDRYQDDADRLFDVIQRVFATAAEVAEAYIPQVGERFLGTVVKTTTFGAFVSLRPGKDGLLHIVQIRKLHGGKRIVNVEDVIHIGDKIQVQIREIDDRGKVSLVPVEVVEREAREAELWPGEAYQRLAGTRNQLAVLVPVFE